MHAYKSMSKSPKQLSCAQRLIMRNILGYRPPAGSATGGHCAKNGGGRAPPERPGPRPRVPTGRLAVAPLTRHSQRGAPAHRLRLELVIVPRDEPAPPHLEQGREECGEGSPRARPTRVFLAYHLPPPG